MRSITSGIIYTTSDFREAVHLIVKRSSSSLKKTKKYYRLTKSVSGGPKTQAVYSQFTIG